MPAANDTAIALDVGSKRVGLALANLTARISSPYSTLERADSFLGELKKVIETENVQHIVIGLPRGLDGQSTAQTTAIAEFAKQIKQAFQLPIYFQDEALTSVKAEEELTRRGRDYKKSDIDALAATYILEDWLAENKEVHEL